MASNSWQQTLSAFVIGAGVGAFMGVLFAPKSGARTRKELAGAVKDGYDGAVAGGQEFARRANETIDDLRERAEDAAEAGQKAYRQAKSNVS